MHEDKDRMFTELERMRTEIDRFFDSLPSPRLLTIWRHHNWSPPTDVYETEEYIIVKVEIAGMRQEDLQISFSSGVLSIAGTRQDPSDKLAVHRLEIAYGDFIAQVSVPWPVDEDRIEARYKDGFLIVMLPQVRSVQKRIPVKVVESEDES